MPLWGSGIIWGSGFIWGSDDPGAPDGFANGQVRIGELTIGAGTVYALEQWNPWGQADVRVSDQTRGQAEGSFPVAGRFGARRLEFTVIIVEATQAAALAAQQTLSAAFAPDPEGDVSALIWREDDVTYRLHGQTRGVAVDTGDRGMLKAQGVIRCTVRFVATDPNVLSDSGKSVTIASRTTPVVEIPLEVPLDWSAATLGTGTVENEGTANTHWRASIRGPASHPSIENVTTGEQLQFHGHLADGDEIMLDSEFRTWVTVGGSVMSITSPAQWWTYPAGETQIIYRGGGSLLMSWRDAWTP